MPLHYTGDRHLLTVAPTRAGKGVAAIIPNLLTYPGSALVIDPKGENAMVTALRRGPGHAERQIEAERAGGHRFDLHRRAARAELHHRALAERPVDLRQRRFQCPLLIPFVSSHESQRRLVHDGPSLMA